MEIKKLKQLVSGIVRTELKGLNFDAFFFGSQVQGDARKGSDLDVGIKINEEEQSNKIARIRNEIDDLPTLRKIDVVDFNKVDDTFSTIAKKNIEKIL
jgi:predicted nucleotidyltransferase